jgi:hypothetical protein
MITIENVTTNIPRKAQAYMSGVIPGQKKRPTAAMMINSPATNNHLAAYRFTGYHKSGLFNVAGTRNP